MEKEKESKLYNQEYVAWAHSHGFLADSAYAYQLSEDNVADYLSDYDYYKIWPLNSWTRIWVNDKLTLKYLLSNNEYGDFMPKYYYYMTSNGLRPLIDNPIQDTSIDSFIALLKEVGEFACKPCNGSLVVGFIRLAYENGHFICNGKPISESELRELVFTLPNYVFTEFIRPDETFAKYSPLIHTLRIVVLNENGSSPAIIGGYLRLPNSNTGDSNFSIVNGDNADAYNVCCEVNWDTGEFGNAKKTFANRVEDIRVHPDTQAELSGVIENFEELKKKVLSIAQRFNTLEYLGFDIGMTTNGFKCMEINTHPGIKYMQVFQPMLKNERLKTYFEGKIRAIDAMSDAEKKKRNSILR